MCFATLGCCGNEHIYDVYRGNTGDLAPQQIFLRCASVTPFGVGFPNTSKTDWSINPSQSMIPAQPAATAVGGLRATDKEFVWSYESRRPTVNSPISTYIVGYDAEQQAEAFALPTSSLPAGSARDNPINFGFFGRHLLPGAGDVAWFGASEAAWTDSRSSLYRLGIDGSLTVTPIVNAATPFVSCFEILEYNDVRTGGVSYLTRAVYTTLEQVSSRCWPRAFGSKTTLTVEFQTSGTYTGYWLVTKTVQHVVGNAVVKPIITNLGGASATTGVAPQFSAALAIEPDITLTTATATYVVTPLGSAVFGPSPTWYPQCADAGEDNYIGVLAYPNYPSSVVVGYGGASPSSVDLRLIQDGNVILNVPALPPSTNPATYFFNACQGFDGYACVTYSSDGGATFPTRCCKAGVEIWRTGPTPLQPSHQFSIVDLSEHWFYLGSQSSDTATPTTAMPNCQYPATKYYSNYLVRNDGSASVPIAQKLPDLPGGHPDAGAGASSGPFLLYGTETDTIYAAVRRKKIPFSLPDTSF